MLALRFNPLLNYLCRRLYSNPQGSNELTLTVIDGTIIYYLSDYKVITDFSLAIIGQLLSMLNQYVKA